MSRRKATFVTGVVGNSGVGKTTLLEELIPELIGRGFEVAVVKHASHGFDVDQPGKDSHRLYTAGPKAVALASGTQLATFVRPDPNELASLEQAMAGLPAGLDVVLVEGFGWEPIPRFVLVRPGQVPRREHRESGPLLRIIEVPEPRPGTKPAFSDELVQGITAEIERRLCPRVVHTADPRAPSVMSRSRSM